MDPKQLNQLDPKLKATYERVMGTVVPPIQKTNLFTPKPNATVSKIPLTSAQPPGNQKSQTAPFEPVKPEPVKPQPFQPFKPQASPKPFQPIKPPNSPIKQAMQTQPQPAPDKKNKLKRIFVLFGGIFFLIGYTFFWIKLFNLKLPFLP